MTGTADWTLDGEPEPDSEICTGDDDPMSNILRNMNNEQLSLWIDTGEIGIMPVQLKGE